MLGFLSHYCAAGRRGTTAVMDFWVCFISDELLSLLWVLKVKLPFLMEELYGNHTLATLSLGWNSASSSGDFCLPTFTSLWPLLHITMTTAVFRAHGWLISPWLAHFSCAHCFQEAPGRYPGSSPVSEGALWNIFTCSLCCKSLKEISPRSCHLPITRPQTECTRLAT